MKYKVHALHCTALLTLSPHFALSAAGIRFTYILVHNNKLETILDFYRIASLHEYRFFWNEAVTKYVRPTQHIPHTSATEEPPTVSDDETL